MCDRETALKKIAELEAEVTTYGKQIGLTNASLHPPYKKWLFEQAEDPHVDFDGTIADARAKLRRACHITHFKEISKRQQCPPDGATIN
jgi:hypothetical protein